MPPKDVVPMFTVTASDKKFLPALKLDSSNEEIQEWLLYKTDFEYHAMCADMGPVDVNVVLVNMHTAATVIAKWGRKLGASTLTDENEIIRKNALFIEANRVKTALFTRTKALKAIILTDNHVLPSMDDDNDDKIAVAAPAAAAAPAASVPVVPKVVAMKVDKDTPLTTIGVVSVHEEQGAALGEKRKHEKTNAEWAQYYAELAKQDSSELAKKESLVKDKKIRLQAAEDIVSSTFEKRQSAKQAHIAAKEARDDATTALAAAELEREETKALHMSAKGVKQAINEEASKPPDA